LKKALLRRKRDHDVWVAAHYSRRGCRGIETERRNSILFKMGEGEGELNLRKEGYEYQ